MTKQSCLLEVLRGSGPARKWPSPARKRPNPETSLPVKLREYVNDSLGISQFITLVFPIKGDVPSLGLIEIKHH